MPRSTLSELTWVFPLQRKHRSRTESTMFRPEASGISPTQYNITTSLSEFMHHNAIHQKVQVGQQGFLVEWCGTKVPFPMSLALPDMAHFQATEGDVVIAGVAKSGASRFSALVGSVLHHKDPKWIYRNPDLQDKIPWLDFCTAVNAEGPRGIEQVSAMCSPRIYWTRMSYEGLPQSVREKAKIVYHVRHPKDCLITLHHHYMARRGYSRYDGQLDSLVDQCVTGNITSGPWFDHYISYWQHRNYANVYICSFEDFSQKPEKSLADLAQFLETPLLEAEMDRISRDCHFDVMSRNSHANHEKNFAVGDFNFDVAKFMRSGKVGGWKQHLTESQNRKMNAWMAEDIKRPEMAGMAEHFPATFLVE